MYLVIQILVLTSVTCVLSCSTTKNDYHYNVIDCKEPQIMALGDYILERLKKTRQPEPTTCFNDNTRFLRTAPFDAPDKKFDGRKLAAVWVYKSINEPGTTFAGPDETIAALETGSTYNVLIDKKFNVHRYVLRNSTDGSITIAFLDEEQLMLKVTNEMFWKHLDVIQCENFLYYLSKQFGNQIISFSIIDKYNSNQELRFVLKSGGIGGFYKKPEAETGKD